MGKKMRFWLVFLSGALPAVFWTFFYFFAGWVPEVDFFRILTVSATKGYMGWMLLFEISRWWDILFGPVFFSIILLFLTSRRFEKIKFQLICGSAIGAAFGLICALFFWHEFSLSFGLVSVFFLALIFGVVDGFFLGLVVGLIGSFSVGLPLGLIHGLIYGLAVFLCTAVVFLPFIGLVLFQRKKDGFE